MSINNIGNGNNIWVNSTPGGALIPAAFNQTAQVINNIFVNLPPHDAFQGVRETSQPIFTQEFLATIREEERKEELHQKYEQLEALVQQVEDCEKKRDVERAIETIRLYLSNSNPVLVRIALDTLYDLIDVICDWMNDSIDQGFEQIVQGQCVVLLKLWGEHPQLLATIQRAEARIVRDIEACKAAHATLRNLANEVVQGTSIHSTVECIVEYAQAIPNMIEAQEIRLVQIADSLGAALEQCTNQGDFELTIFLCDRLLRFHNNPSKVLLAKARALLIREEKEAKGTLRRTLESIKEVIERLISENKIAESIQWIVAFCLKNQRMTDAEATFLHHLCDIICDQCNHIKNTNYPLIISYCDQLLAHGMKTPKLFISKAQALRAMNRYKESLQAIDQALEMNSKDVTALHLKAFNLYILGQYAESEAICNELLERNPYHQVAKIKAEILGKQGQYQEALAWIRSQLQIDPTDQTLIERQYRLYRDSMR